MKKKEKPKKRTFARRLLTCTMLFYFLAFGLLFLYAYDVRALVLALAVPAGDRAGPATRRFAEFVREWVEKNAVPSGTA